MKNKTQARRLPTNKELKLYREFADKITTIEEMSIPRVEKSFFMKIASKQYREVCKFLEIERL